MGETTEKLRRKRNAEIQASLNKNPKSLIDWFDDLGTGNETYRFLSNFYEGEPLVVPGLGAMLGLKDEIEFPTGENLFQAFKAKNLNDFLMVGTAPGGTYEVVGDDGKPKIKDGKVETYTESAPAESKRLGRTIRLRADWEQVKYDIMAMTVRVKFDQDREEAKRLLETGDAYLQEGTWWGDDTWGVLLDVEGRPGRNWLGSLLMMRRAELRSGLMGRTYSADTVMANLGRASVGWI